MPRLSVLVPAFNAAETVQATLRSILRQLPRDAEVVVLDDGSSDGTAEAAERTDDHRVRVLSRPNAGVATTLNDLLAVTDSELVARMDADDLVIPGRFPRQLKAIQGGADVVFTTMLTHSGRVPHVPLMSRIEPDDFGLYLLLTNPVSHPTLLGRRESLESVGGYRSVPAEDYDLWLRMAANGTRMLRLALPGHVYRLHPGQVTAVSGWRRSSWESPELASAYSGLAEQLLGAPAMRITSLSIDETLSAAEKRARVDAFGERFTQRLKERPRFTRFVLGRKLAQRRAWLETQLAGPQRSSWRTDSAGPAVHPRA